MPDMIGQKGDPERIASNFAEQMPIGTRCRYYPILPAEEDDFETTTIQSAPWVLGHGAVVVKIDGRSGGVLVTHIRPMAIGS